nr:PREDICTED: probable cytochrome P450 6a14 [Bemisia tabaci]
MAAFTILSTLPSVTSVVLIVSSVALCAAYYLHKKYSYWAKRDVPYVKPDSWFFGNTKEMIFQRESTTFMFARLYNELAGHKFGGYYRNHKPFLVLRDPELIRLIFVKNFSHFHDRNTPDERDFDPLSKHLLNLRGQRWKNVRYKLTPTFSSGKLKGMHELMQACIVELDDYLTKATSGDSKDSNVQDLRELMAKFTTDVIGACAFGLNCNSIRDENSEFRRIGRLIFSFSWRSYIRAIVLTLAPGIVMATKWKNARPEIENFFMSVLKGAVEHRKSHTEQKRNDFLQLLINIQAEERKQLESNGQHNGTQNGTQNGIQNGLQNGHAESVSEKSKDILFDDSVVASNAFIFFIAGFETTASTLSYCLYELALNPDIGEKLYEEVESVKQAHNGTLDYDAVNKELVYMEAVISETLRKYPPASVLGRRCNEAFQIPDTNVVIEEGVGVTVSVYGLHHDPQYFPEPEKFKPERFLGENKDKIVPGSYLPFGDGPRICIGMRFAHYEMKSVLSYIISNYTIHRCNKTVVPLQYDTRSLLHTPVGGVWVQFQKRPK